MLRRAASLVILLLPTLAQSSTSWAAPSPRASVRRGTAEQRRVVRATLTWLRDGKTWTLTRPKADRVAVGLARFWPGVDVREPITETLLRVVPVLAERHSPFVAYSIAQHGLVEMASRGVPIDEANLASTVAEAERWLAMVPGGGHVTPISSEHLALDFVNGDVAGVIANAELTEVPILALSVEAAVADKADFLLERYPDLDPAELEKILREPSASATFTRGRPTTLTRITLTRVPVLHLGPIVVHEQAHLRTATRWNLLPLVELYVTQLRGRFDFSAQRAAAATDPAFARLLQTKADSFIADQLDPTHALEVKRMGAGYGMDAVEWSLFADLLLALDEFNAHRHQGVAMLEESGARVEYLLDPVALWTHLRAVYGGSKVQDGVYTSLTGRQVAGVVDGLNAQLRPSRFRSDPGQATSYVEGVVADLVTELLAE